MLWNLHSKMTIYTKEPSWKDAILRRWPIKKKVQESSNVEKSNQGCPRSQCPKSKAKWTDTYKKNEELKFFYKKNLKKKVWSFCFKTYLIQSLKEEAVI
jgi:hypothetical protein